MQNKYILVEVTNSHLEHEFLDLPKRLYANHPYWVCPSDSAIQHIFNPQGNVFYAQGDAIRWIVQTADRAETVGRIGAFYNLGTSQLEEQPTGGCGFYESIESQEVANMLFDASHQWLAGHGMEAMDGPINFGSREAYWGLLVDGFDFAPLYENVYNLPYYQALFENYGFQNYFNQNSYLYRIGQEQLNPVVERKADRLLTDPSYSVRNIRGRKLRDVAMDFRSIYNQAWAAFPGVEPMSEGKVLELLRSMQPIIDPDILFFAYHEGNPIGFFVSVPDINPILKDFNGKFGLWQKLQLLYQVRFGSKCNRIFGVIFGVIPEYQFRGVESAMIKHLRDDYAMTPRNKRYKTLEFAWIGDFNPIMNKMLEKYVGAKRHKQHVTYRYLFDRTKEFKRCPQLERKRPTQ